MNDNKKGSVGVMCNTFISNKGFSCIFPGCWLGLCYLYFRVPVPTHLGIDRLKPLIKCQLGPDRNFISHFCEAANAESSKSVHSLHRQMLNDTAKVTLQPIPNSAHYTLPLMDCNFHRTMSLSFLQPSSRIKVWVICLHYLVYFPSVMDGMSPKDTIGRR